MATRGKRIFDDGELFDEATIKKFFIIQNEGKCQSEHGIDHYNLQIIIIVDFKVNNNRVVRFRKWAGKDDSNFATSVAKLQDKGCL